MLLRPEVDHNRKYFGSWNKVMNLEQDMFYEAGKYHNKFNAKLSAANTLNNLPICFDKCIKDVSGGSGLTSVEKNCMRECYIKRSSVKNELWMYMV